MARILLADDEAASRDLVRRALEADGHRVTVVEDGATALARLGASPDGFDLLLTDVQMPGLDGVALAERAKGLAPAMCIMLMSGYDLGSVRLPTPGVRRIAKPFTNDEIRAAVRSALAG